MVTSPIPPLLAVVPSRDLHGLLHACLHSLATALQNVEDRDTVVCVVDNASERPYEADHWDGVGRIIRLDHHQSFSTCVNRAAELSPSHDLLLVNNDCFVSPLGSVEMLAALNMDGMGIAGSRLVFPDGTLQHDGVGVGSNGPFHLRRGQQPGLFPLSLTYPIAVTGALMTIRRQVFDDLNGFDTSYPFGLEDIDFCHRARQKGWHVSCTHKYPSLHLEATTPGRIEMDIESRALYMERWAHKIPPSVRNNG